LGGPARHGRVAAARRPDAFSALAWPIAIGLLLLILYPFAATLLRTFVVAGQLDLSPLGKVVADSAFHVAARNTIIILAVSGSAALVIGSAFAWLNERTDASIGAVSRLAPLIPLLIPSIALSIGWVLLAQPRAGFLNGFLRGGLDLIGVELTQGPFDIGTWPGLIFVYTISLVPYAYIVVAPALRNMDSSLEEASRMAGAGPLRTAMSVTLPAIRPALASAALLIVIIGITMFSIPRTIGLLSRVDTVSVYIVRLTQESPSRLDEAVAVSLIMLVGLSLVWLAQRRLTMASRQVTISGKAGSGAVVRLGPLRWVARAVILLYLLLVSVMPFLALVVVALQPFWQASIDVTEFSTANFTDFLFGSNPRGRRALVSSLQLATLGATVLVTVAAIVMTYARQAGGAKANIISGLTKFPAAIPNLVIGVAILVALAGPPFRLGGTLMILLLGYVVAYIPQASIAAEVARGQVGQELMEASAMLGGTRARTFRRILLPLMRPGLAYGWALIFVMLVGDLTISAILSGPGNLVVGSIFLDIWDSGVFADLATLGTIVCVTSLVVVGTVTSIGRMGPRRTADSGEPAAIPRPT
jgi:iron(III) transport system permease protein